jgi:hypothetical protein
MGEVVNLAEVRRLRESERRNPDEQDEEEGRLSPALLRDMALLLLGLPPDGPLRSGLGPPRKPK